MKLINNSPRNYVAYDIILKAGEIIELDGKEHKRIIDILKKQPDVSEYVDKKDVENLQAQVKKLAKELEKEKKQSKKANNKTKNK